MASRKKLSRSRQRLWNDFRLVPTPGDGYRLELLVLSDGYQAGGGINLGGSALTRTEAARIATKAALPKLPDASVTVAGIGKVTSGGRIAA